MRARTCIMGLMMVTILATGCSTTNQSGMASAEQEYVPPTSIYNILDSTAMIYSDPSAGSPINDNPLRWLGFMLHPIGQALDYAVNRPIYKLASMFPYATGYTQEDAMVDAQRR